MVVGPEDPAGWCIVIGLRSTLLASNAQVRAFVTAIETRASVCVLCARLCV